MLQPIGRLERARIASESLSGLRPRARDERGHKRVTGLPTRTESWPDRADCSPAGGIEDMIDLEPRCTLADGLDSSQQRLMALV